MTEDEPQTSDDDVRTRLHDLAESGDPWTDPLPRVLAVAAPRPESLHRDRRSWRVGLAVAAAVAVVVGGIGWTLRDVGGSEPSTSAGLAEGDAAGAPAPASAGNGGGVQDVDGLCGSVPALVGSAGGFTTSLATPADGTYTLSASSLGAPLTLPGVGARLLIVSGRLVVAVLDDRGAGSVTVSSDTPVATGGLAATDCRTGAPLARAEYDVYAIATSYGVSAGPWAGPVRLTLG